MYIFENIPLSTLSTMRLGGFTRYMSDVNSRNDIKESFEWAKTKNVPIIMIGQGSNIIWSDEGFDGLVLVNKILGFEVFEEDDENIYVTIGAGENWDEIVSRTVAKGYSGIEQLSLIPGTVGATPVQNVGAYGREISDLLTTIEAFDTKEEEFVTLRGSDCGLGYRTSRFKTTDQNRFLINSITIRLSKTPPKPPFYNSLQKYLNEKGVTGYSPQSIRDAVIAIRSAKLPDPAKVANVGSFFHNPIVDSRTASLLVNQYENIPHWPQEDGKFKLSAAWLLEQAGFKDYHDKETGFSTWPNQPLVIVNEQASKTKDLLVFRDKLTTKVKQKFGIDLQQEPEILGNYN